VDTANLVISIELLWILADPLGQNVCF